MNDELDEKYFVNKQEEFVKFLKRDKQKREYIKGLKLKLLEKNKI